MYLRNLFIFLGLIKFSFAQRLTKEEGSNYFPFLHKLSNEERLYKHLFEHSMRMNESEMGSGEDDYYYEEEEWPEDLLEDNSPAPTGTHHKVIDLFTGQPVLDDD